MRNERREIKQKDEKMTWKKEGKLKMNYNTKGIDKTART